MYFIVLEKGSFLGTLCEACDHCPSVEIDDKCVRIGEDHNTVTLTHPQWNDTTEAGLVTQRTLALKWRSA